MSPTSSDTLNLIYNQKDPFTNPIMTGTSTSGTITAVKASPEFKPNTATATVMANSKLLLAVVNDRVAVRAGSGNLIAYDVIKSISN